MDKPTLVQVEILASQLDFKDQCALLEHVSRRVRLQAPHAVSKSYVNLRDIYKGAVPEDFDFDATLREIRSEWTKEIDEMQEPG